jgi:hypothetical protein
MKMIVRYCSGIRVIIKIFSLILIVTSLLNNHIYSQTDSTSAVTEDIIYDLLQESRVEGDNEDIYLILENLANNPIDLNSANLSELQKIPGLTNYFALKIIEYKKSFGPFFSVEELLLVEGFSKELLEQVKPFLIVRHENLTDVSTDQRATKSMWNIFNENVKLNTRSRITNDLQERKGFAENKFQGSIPKIYNRLLLRYSELIEAGLLTEKDAGEKSFSEFISFHFALNNFGIMKTFAAGDYTLEFGQGLALWSPFALSKGTDAIYPVKRKAKPINPYKSTNENNFFRGAALSVNYKSFTVSSFYSNNFFDANIDSISREILSTPIDGYHRTDSEINKKRSARETFYGGRIDFADPNSKINDGILFYNSKFSNSFFQESPFDIGGNNFTYYSVYYDLYFGNVNLLGESAFDGRSIASLISANFAFHKNFSFITLIRNYPRNYRNIHSYAFGENSGATQNEFGIYTGFQWRTFLGEINFYFDQYKFPYATFENSLPSSGNEFLLDLRSKLTSKIETDLRFNYDKKEVTETFENVKSMLTRLRQTIRGEIIYEVSKKLRLKSRLEFNSYRIDHANINEEGLMVFQDIRYSPSQNLSIDGRIILFQTDSFNSAIYEYENDLNGILSNAALYGEGMRWYFHVRFKPVKFLSIAVKYSETFKPLEKNLGSGLSEINNNLDNKLGLQLEMSF